MKIVNLFVFFLILSLSLSFLMTQDSQERPLRIFAASSLSAPLKEIHRLFPKKVTLNLAASSILARQIIQGAEADIFLSANKVWIEELAGNLLLDESTRHVFTRNRLVLASQKSYQKPNPFDFFSFLNFYKEGHIAIADPEHVPLGFYTREILDKHHLFDALKPKFSYYPDASRVVTALRSTQVSLAFIYQSDTVTYPDLKTFHLIDEEDHQPVEYFAVKLKGKMDCGYMDLLTSRQGQDVFKKFGFETIDY